MIFFSRYGGTSLARTINSLPFRPANTFSLQKNTLKRIRELMTDRSPIDLIDPDRPQTIDHQHQSTSDRFLKSHSQWTETQMEILLILKSCQKFLVFSPLPLFPPVQRAFSRAKRIVRRPGFQVSYAVMNPLMRIACALLVLGMTFPARGHGVSEDMAEAAQTFLNALNETQRGKAVYELKDDERFNWHFVPKARKGLSFKEMEPHQRALAHALLSSGLSHRGYFKASTIMSLEQILKETEKGSGPTRDPEAYFVTIFGKPESHGNWAWRFEGHHLALNFTVAGHEVAVTPSFMGTNPGEVREGPRKGLRVLGREEDLARELVKSLNAEQQKVAIFTNKAPADIITGADRKARVLEPKGISKNKLNKKQQQLLMSLIEEYLYRARPEVAQAEMKEVEDAAAKEIWFAWGGSTEPKEGHYYRVQGPTFLLEYDNTQNNANHVHAVWRDLKNDFGEDILRKHYDESHSK
jgi:hypothetical protein